MKTTNKMTLRVWTSLQDDYDHEQLADNWAKLDAHDHTSGRGVQIPSEGIVDGAISFDLLSPEVQKLITEIAPSELKVKKYKESVILEVGVLAIQATPGQTFTLPEPAVPGKIIGIFCLAAAESVKVKTIGTTKILGDWLSSIECTLTTNQHLLLYADGTNWLMMSGTPKLTNTYSAAATYVNNEEREPSATRPVFVTATHERSSNSTIEYEVYVGGVMIQRGSIIGWGELKAGEHALGNSISFIVPPGQSWKIKSTGSGSGLLQYSYLVL